MELKVICKRLITQDLDESITEGEYGADIVGITVPRMYGEHDLSLFSFRLTAISKLNESVAEQVLTMDSYDDENIHLLWEVTSDFTASSGEVTLILAGVNSDNTVQIKFLSQPVTINDDCRLEFTESPTILEQAYNQVQLEAQKAVEAAERAEEIASRPIIVPVATESEIGGIKAGDDVSVSEEGVVTVNSVGGKTVLTSVPENAVFTDTVYSLPVASESVLGGIKSGNDISVSGNGVVTVNSVGGKTVLTSVPKNAVFTDTVYSLPVASNKALGGVKIDNSSIIIDSKGTISATGFSGNNGEVIETDGFAALENSVAYPILSLNLYGNSVQDGTPTEETPVDISCVGDDGTVSITSCGNNLAEISTSVCDVDGQRITMKSTAGSGQRLFANQINLKKGQTLFCNFILYNMSDTSADRSITIYVSDVMGDSVFAHLNKYNYDQLYTKTYTATEDCTIQFRLWGTSTVSTLEFAFWCNIGEALEFEPYNGSTASITSGLPLCSVGEACDKLCFNADGTGKVIKRTAVIDSYNGEEISGEYLSTTGGLTTGARVVYALDEAVEVELTAAEITALMKLQTLDGVTDISNDEGADMDVKILTSPVLSEYVMPVISGQNKRIEALEAAVLSLGGNI